MRRSLYSLKTSSLFLTFFLLISCNTSTNASDDPSVYALKNSENFKNVKGYMVYAHMDTHITYMEVRLRNLHTGEDEVLISTKDTIYSELFPTNINSKSNLIFINAYKPNTDDIFMLLYNLKKRTYKELDIGHSALSGGVSAEKSKLVFYSDFKDQLQFSIYISNLDGKDLLKLDCPKSSCTHPSWNVDGSRIVYLADRRKVYEYNLKTKLHKLRYTLTNKRKYELNYPFYFNNDIYFNKIRKIRRYSNKVNTEILKISNNKILTFFKSSDTFYSISFLTTSIFLSEASSSNKNKSKGYMKILIYDKKLNNHFSLSTSDIFKYQNTAPFYLDSL